VHSHQNCKADKLIDLAKNNKNISNSAKNLTKEIDEIENHFGKSKLVNLNRNRHHTVIYDLGEYEYVNSTGELYMYEIFVLLIF
jgi:hypothetical protein